MTDTDKLSRIEKLRQQRDQLNARIQRAEAQEKQKARTKQKRLWILYGQVMEGMLRSGEMPADEWQTWCKKYLIKEQEQQAAIEGINLFPRSKSDVSTPDTCASVNLAES
ncbi:MAG: hypothetical protein V2J55_21665 [Candidatus Competibacteraceae bacterium]|jgi:hypothetical protein|nr:hypothetical protein [Candidatus Competibacteraceae bacterium]